MNPAIVERFWGKVDRSGGPDACWPWLASRNALGYGQFYPGLNGKQGVGAHRFAFTITCGEPGDLEVMHGCDNPPCVNPSHLRAGTHAENLRDASRRGLFRVKVSDAAVIELRERVAGGETVAVVSRDLGIGYSAAKKIVKGWLRPHVGGPLTRRRERPAGTVR